MSPRQAPRQGAVSLNLRLTPDEIAWIANHAQDRFLVVDDVLLPLYEQFRSKASLEKVVVVPLTRAAVAAPAVDYEAFLAGAPAGFDYAAHEEDDPVAMCYTSGTTGRPKGVVYSHRSTVIHTLMANQPDHWCLSAKDTVLPATPMFHANCWGVPYVCVMMGIKMVFPGPHLAPADLLDLFAAERPTYALGVPTIWLGMLQLLDQQKGVYDTSTLRTTLVGGSAAPPSMIEGFEKRHGIIVLHAWGMTEMNPLGTVARVKHKLAKADYETRLGLRSSQGLPSMWVETRHVGPDGRELPRDGETMGELEVRGPWVARSYLGGEGEDRFTSDGWFKTGDVVTIDSEGYVRITDRAKDVIKSGGEWISSVALENALMSHGSVLEAAVFAGQHEKWGERPIAAVVFKTGQRATPDELRNHLAAHFHKMWLPDEFVIVPQIPRTSTGKFLKTKLREEFGGILKGKG